MRDTFVSCEQCIIKGTSCIFTGEVTRFRDRDEKLLTGGRVHREVVDRFMWNRSFAFPLANIWCLGEHGKNGFGVGGREFFTLALTVSHRSLGGWPIESR